MARHAGPRSAGRRGVIAVAALGLMALVAACAPATSEPGEGGGVVKHLRGDPSATLVPPDPTQAIPTSGASTIAATDASSVDTTTSAPDTIPPIVAPLAAPTGKGPAPTDPVRVPANPSRPVVVPGGPEEAAARGCIVTIVGDSLTVAATSDLASALWAEGCSVNMIAAKGGASTAYGVRMARDLADAGLLGKIVIAALGTNDCASKATDFDRSIDAFMSVVGNRPVVWPTTNISKQTPYCVPMGAVQANGRILAAAGRHPNIRVADWWSLASTHPEWQVDGVHLSSVARRIWASFLAGAASAVAAGNVGGASTGTTRTGTATTRATSTTAKSSTTTTAATEGTTSSTAPGADTTAVDATTPTTASAAPLESTAPPTSG